MLQKIVESAGYTVISLEDRQCLLDCVENLQLQRDKYRDLMMNHLDPEAGIQVEDVIDELSKVTDANRRLERKLYQLKLKVEGAKVPRRALQRTRQARRAVR